MVHPTTTVTIVIEELQGPVVAQSSDYHVCLARWFQKRLHRESNTWTKY